MATTGRTMASLYFMKQVETLLEDAGLLEHSARGVGTKASLPRHEDVIFSKVGQLRQMMHVKAGLVRASGRPAQRPPPAKRRKGVSFDLSEGSVGNLSSDTDVCMASMTTTTTTTGGGGGKRVRHKRWTEEEEDVLVEEHKKFGSYQRGMWKVIAKKFPGRTVESVRDHWHQAGKYKPKSKLVAYQKSLGQGSGSRWTDEEEETMVLAHKLAAVGGRRVVWADITKWFPRRKQKQITQRWKRALVSDPKSPLQIYRAELARKEGGDSGAASSDGTHVEESLCS
ncbi:hypothetical protein HOP50_01g01300 [Chloropicon primus]|uniref:Uncharacterized protein n=1 Tax=Chloropicon primus TaxID=1764295 RepID=A0A5B8MBB5_9CHLO|nr:hypothetical protein A3770_01p01410 [Chloropicon primus]UPQ96839.1 hypothetical protein HOP50_01g01300 [Chloropicon primus]|eukprot:QDZ17623.1 hypothetical protein A3770_01p01410 [Chloropicon primus]